MASEGDGPNDRAEEDKDDYRDREPIHYSAVTLDLRVAVFENPGARFPGIVRPGLGPRVIYGSRPEPAHDRHQVCGHESRTEDNARDRK